MPLTKVPKVWIRWAVAGLLLGVLVILGFVVFFADDDSRHHALGAALWSTAVVMLVVVLLLEWAGNSGKVEGGSSLVSWKRSWGRRPHLD